MQYAKMGFDSTIILGPVIKLTDATAAGTPGDATPDALSGTGLTGCAVWFRNAATGIVTKTATAQAITHDGLGVYTGAVIPGAAIPAPGMARFSIVDSVFGTIFEDVEVLHPNVYDAKFGSVTPLTDKAGFSIAAGGIATASFAAGTTIPRVTLADTVTTLTGYTTPPSAAVIGAAVWADSTGVIVKTSTDKIPASPAAVGSVMQIDLTQDVAARDVTQKTTMNVGDCLAGAIAESAGAESVVGLVYAKKNLNGSAFRTFSLNDATNPTTRS